MTPPYKIIMRSHPDRDDLVEQIKPLLPEDSMYSRDFAREGGRVNFIRAMTMAEGDACLHLEDDIILCRDFIDNVNRVVEYRPGTVIQFFSRRSADIDIGSRYESGRTFLGALCFFLPCGMSRDLLNHWPAWKDKDKHFDAVDLFVADYLKSQKLKYWIEIPCLVQHRQVVSVVDSRRSKYRQTSTFLGE